RERPGPEQREGEGDGRCQEGARPQRVVVRRARDTRGGVLDVLGQGRQGVQGEGRLVRQARPGEVAVLHLRPVPQGEVRRQVPGQVRQGAVAHRGGEGREEVVRPTANPGRPPRRPGGVGGVIDGRNYTR